MIYTVTFNPALDYVVHMDGFELGETNRSSNEELYYGGKGINVSTVLTNLGIPNVALGFVAGFTGAEIENGIKELGINSDFIHLKTGNSRINVKIKSGVETEINGQGPVIDQESLDELFKKTEKLKDGDSIVLAGSIPKTLPENIYEKLLSTLCNKKVNFVVDATNDLLVNVLKFKPFFVKPNVKELGDIFGVKIKGDDQIEFYAKKLQEMGAKNILVSMGKNGAMLISEDGGVFKAGIVGGKAKNSVGAGDSMVAGFLAGWLEKKDYEYALQLGSAAGSATACSGGLARKEEINKALDELIKSEG